VRHKIDGPLKFTNSLKSPRDALLRRLCELKNSKDAENSHSEADELLLGYINDKEISAAFNALVRWYS
jgi:hypothetical protein